jgi:hypothetical protein
LRDELRLEVLNASFPGSGAFGALKAHLLSPEYAAAPPKVLVWETLLWGWHKHPSLTEELRQVLPSVAGACATPVLTKQLQAPRAGETVLATGLTPLDLRGPESYLQLDTDDRALAEVTLELRYRG